MTSKQIKAFHDIVTELQKHDEVFDDFLAYEIDKELQYMETGISLKKICKFYFHDYIDILKKDSNFKRIIMYIDFEENNKKIPTSTS